MQVRNYRPWRTSYAKARRQRDRYDRSDSSTSSCIKVSTYSLKADSYVWNRGLGGLKMRIAWLPIQFYFEKTGNELSLKDLVPDEGSLLGIQQVIQQKLLDQAKEPTKIIDAVLGMDRITYDSKFTYDPEK